MVFPVVMYGCENWSLKKAECRRIDTFELWCWRRLLRGPWAARRPNQSILREISPGCSLEGQMLKLKLQYFGHLRLIGRDPDAGKDWRQEEKGMTEDEMVGWHHRLDGREFEQAPGVGEGQWGLACCSPWGHKESDTTERLNWWASQAALVVKEPACQCRRCKRQFFYVNAGSDVKCRFNPGAGRSPGEGHGNPLRYSCPENPMDRGAWRARVHRVIKSWTWLKWLNTCKHAYSWDFK